MRAANKKRVLVFIEDGSFTFDNRVIREVSALEHAGWEVTVISPKYPQDPFYRRVSEHVRAYFYPKPTADSALGHVFEHSISLMLGSILTLWVFVRHGFGVFHACNPMDILWMVAAPYKLVGRRFVFDQHDLCPELYLSRGEGGERSLWYRGLLALEKWSYRLADIVIATNESYKEIAMSRGNKQAGDVFVVRNGPDLDKFRKVDPAKGLKGQDEKLIGYLGNMNRQDGVEIILEAANHIIRELNRRDVRFILIGGGGAQADLRRQCEEMGLEPHVRFTGRIPDAEMLATLSACDICVQPDPSNPLNDKSTMNKVMEYMALEKPVVAFDLKETRVSCGPAALYAKANDVRDFAKQILTLVDDERLAESLGREGRARVEQALSWEHSIPHLLEAYGRVSA